MRSAATPKARPNWRAVAELGVDGRAADPCATKPSASRIANARENQLHAVAKLRSLTVHQRDDTPMLAPG
jgi:hypothetical protein